jgi:hypothetical protein
MTTRTVLILGLLWAAAAAPPVRAQQAASDGPVLTADGKLQRPVNYREWVFLTSSYNLTYGPAAAGQDTRIPPFNNVFVNPSSYREFMKTGKWPDRTIFILEIRRASNTGLLSKDRRFQTDVTGLEANVKDARLPGGWGWFGFGDPKAFRDVSAMIPNDSKNSCLQCHTQHGAVEKTFVQFYPELYEVAKRMGTVNAGYDPSHAF